MGRLGLAAKDMEIMRPYTLIIESLPQVPQETTEDDPGRAEDVMRKGDASQTSLSMTLNQ